MNINKCPFCGSNNVDLERDPEDISDPENVWRFVVCHDCAGRGPSSTDVIEAIKLWNNSGTEKENKKEFENTLEDFSFNTTESIHKEIKKLEKELSEEDQKNE